MLRGVAQTFKSASQVSLVTYSPAKSSSPKHKETLVYNSARSTGKSTAMAFPFPSLASLLARRPLLLYAATWTAVATTAVAVAAFAPELAFIWAVGPEAPLARACPDGGGASGIGLPLDGPPWDAVCVPAGLFGRTGPDVIVPLVFAVVVVASAVGFTTAVGVWEEEEDDEAAIVQV